MLLICSMTENQILKKPMLTTILGSTTDVNDDELESSKSMWFMTPRFPESEFLTHVCKREFIDPKFTGSILAELEFPLRCLSSKILSVNNNSFVSLNYEDV